MAGSFTKARSRIISSYHKVGQNFRNRPTFPAGHRCRLVAIYPGQVTVTVRYDPRITGRLWTVTVTLQPVLHQPQRPRPRHGLGAPLDL